MSGEFLANLTADGRRAHLAAGLPALAVAAVQATGLAPAALQPLHMLPVGLLAWSSGPRRAGALALLLGAWGGWVGAFASPAAAAVWTATAAALGLLVSKAAALYRSEHRDARYDPLTGALNRRAFTEGLERNAAEAQSDARPRLLIYLDLDGFKAVNDVHGHDVGDDVLRHFAASVRSRLGPSDVFARLGGDEFVLLVLEDPALDSYTQADMLHEAFSDALAELPYGVTCSVGAILISPPITARREDLMRWADELMYEVKRAGKNALRIARASDLAMAA